MAYKKYNKSNKIENIIFIGILIITWNFTIKNIGLLSELNLKLLPFIPVIILLIYILIKIIYKNIKLINNEKRKKEKFPQLILEIEEKIRGFKPLRSYNYEETYQIELAGYLKNNYPNLDIEKSIDYSRPDIIIDNIAIEIKGPTNMQALKTIPDKINSYLPKRDFLFIVLFNINIIDYDKEKNMDIYYEKKKEILENTIENKRDKIIFIEIKS
ncbi:MAG: hypothetical protein PHV23_03215 [Candidatus Gracilibacteria bacterium]|nr:hypothetical protein [Candidatus Gracilibacteria bacterium]